MTNKSVAKHSAADDQLQHVEAHERKASAEAKAGLNLNILGALSGTLSSLTTKRSSTAPDGSATTEEEQRTAVRADGRGAASGSAVAAARADASDRHVKEGRVDHLGIEE
ncbi:uncharacterized protein K452DRAFT_322484 [Aplosporella prunicola CBS 121167]|uniref:Uncharacterized protein n=1 Tax=Aplosporella prunicola CBS 121167 TaxID=1176127 RepID=A0A6A6AZY8_9PEZI|nr:uncharacterized protein K452DRAFT_322484 [Aplosporella prunicola CBS 121167]KAF2136337.1 hypothetical protein K452DRAFT_322484 [Aplosporella prunicola CBS 121167]